MPFPSKLRPVLLVGLFFSILLGIVLISPSKPTIALPADQAMTELSVTQGTQKTVLSNGLTVLTKEIHTAPVVSVQIWYRVGSRNEPSGQNGISHQLEHLMFKGTSDRPIQFGRLFSALGSQSNAFTSYDETAYYGTVEKEKLEALLTLEADRMKQATIGESQLASEKRVVISELQGYENNPRYRLEREVMRAAFPDRPYGLPVGGTRADVQNFTLEQVRSYYQRYYSPENAVLVVTGDFTTEPTLQRIREIFEPIPQGSTTPTAATAPRVAPSSHPAPTVTRQPVVLREPGTTALIHMIYPLPEITHPDVTAIDLMDMILTGGRSARLYQSLVESGLASSVGAYPAEMIEPGWYEITAIAAPNKELSQLAQVLQQSLTELQQQLVTTEELNRAKTQLRALFILNNQDITSQAMQLAYNQIVTGDYQFSDRYLAALESVTPEDIQRVARTYLDPAKQTIGFFEPTLANGQPGTSSNGNSGRTVENFSAGPPVDPAEVARYLPPITSSTDTTPQPLPEKVTLPNGLRVLLFPDPSTPTINLSGWVQAGTVLDLDYEPGTASLTAANLMNGTQTKTALEIAQALEDQGANLSFEANREGVSIEASALSTSLPTVIETLADVLQQATFPADQLELSRQRALVRLRLELDDPQQLGWRLFRQAVYPANHPFHSFPTEESLTRINQANIEQFYRENYRPDSTVLALVGNFDPATVRQLLEQNFDNWQVQGRQPSLRFPSVSLPRSQTRLNQAMTGKSEAVTFMGYNGISRRDPRFYAAIVMNQILGGDTLASRLGTEIRDRQGLTYGIYSYFVAGVNAGPFSISMQTSPTDANQAIDSTVALLQQLREHGITAEELSAAQRSITNSYPVDLASPSSIASEILMNEVYGLSQDELRQFPSRIKAVTLEQVQQVIRELIHPDNLVIVTAGPGDVTSSSH
ncbi:MAG: pitrilysin family protein [Oculatellaceae cyanobacterium bins.114]|nr:pitrilysin family protein [Oculatellaceae cyanobacterium bins.114]